DELGADLTHLFGGPRLLTVSHGEAPGSLGQIAQVRGVAVELLVHCHVGALLRGQVRVDGAPVRHNTARCPQRSGAVSHEGRRHRKELSGTTLDAAVAADRRVASAAHSTVVEISEEVLEVALQSRAVVALEHPELVDLALQETA